MTEGIGSRTLLSCTEVSEPVTSLPRNLSPTVNPEQGRLAPD
jgi:hypothetical protein